MSAGKVLLRLWLHQRYERGAEFPGQWAVCNAPRVSLGDIEGECQRPGHMFVVESSPDATFHPPSPTPEGMPEPNCFKCAECGITLADEDGCCLACGGDTETWYSATLPDFIRGYRRGFAAARKQDAHKYEVALAIAEQRKADYDAKVEALRALLRELIEAWDDPASDPERIRAALTRARAEVEKP